MIDITARLQGYLDEASGTGGKLEGVLHVLIQHTSASLTIQENADPDVRADLLDFLDRAAPETGPYRHIAEGRDDMPAHIKAAMTATTLSLPVTEGKLMLGTWQGVYVIEHRGAAHQRKIVLSFTAESE